jgi:hypothetical protein
MLEGVELRDVDPDEADLVVLKRGLRGGREIAQPRADDQHQVRIASQEIRRLRSRGADAAKRQRVRVGQGALSCLRFTHRDAGGIHQSAEGVGRVAVQDAAAGNDQRPPAGANELGGLLEPIAIRARPRNRPDARLEQRRRIVVRLGLHVLRKGQRHGAGFRRRRQHAHRFGQRGDDLLRTVDPIPVSRHRPEAVVDRHVLRLARLELLQHGGRAPAGEAVARQEKDRHAVDRRAGGAGDHVGGAGADRAGAGKHPQPVVHFGVGRRRVHHRLLVARQVVGQRAALFVERLANAGDVPVAEDPEDAATQRLFAPIARRALPLQKPHHGLRHRQADFRSRRRHIVGSPCAVTNAATSSSVGMKLAHPWRVTTIAPQALPIRAARSSGQPCR